MHEVVLVVWNPQHESRTYSSNPSNSLKMLSSVCRLAWKIACRSEISLLTVIWTVYGFSRRFKTDAILFNWEHYGTPLASVIQEPLSNSVFLASCWSGSANLFGSMYWPKSLDLRVILTRRSPASLMIQLFLGLEGFHGSALVAVFHFNTTIMLTNGAKIEGEPTPTADLTAKPAILSTSQCISAIQQNTGGILFRLSQAASSSLANSQRVSLVPIPNTAVIPSP